MYAAECPHPAHTHGHRDYYIDLQATVLAFGMPRVASTLRGGASHRIPFCSHAAPYGSSAAGAAWRDVY